MSSIVWIGKQIPYFIHYITKLNLFAFILIKNWTHTYTKRKLQYTLCALLKVITLRGVMAIAPPYCSTPIANCLIKKFQVFFVFNMPLKISLIAPIPLIRSVSVTLFFTHLQLIMIKVWQNKMILTRHDRYYNIIQMLEFYKILN